MSRARAGFTLLEVLIAVVILGMIVSLIYGSFAMTAQSKEKTEAGNAIYHEARWAMNKLEDDLGAAYVTRNRNTRSLLVGFSRDAGGNMPMDELHFSSFSHVKYNPQARESDQAEISYFVTENPESGIMTLYRREDPTPDDENMDGGEFYDLVEGVLGFDLTYYDGFEWADEWDSRDFTDEIEEVDTTGPIENQTDEMVNTLPMAIEVRLLVEGPPDPNGEPTSIPFHTKIRLVLSTIDLSILDEGDDESGDGGDDGGGGTTKKGGNLGAGGGLSSGALGGGG